MHVNENISKPFLIQIPTDNVSTVFMKFALVFICTPQGDAGEAARQVPSPRLLHLHRLQRQPQAERTFLCGGPDLL